MLAVEELRALVESGEIRTVVTAFPDLYGRLVGKRVTGRFLRGDPQFFVLRRTYESGASTGVFRGESILRLEGMRTQHERIAE